MCVGGGGVPHGSPELVGVECQEIRGSVEMRIMGFGKEGCP
jgi:hypothetical protein